MRWVACFKEPKITCVRVVLLGFIIIMMFMAVLHTRWLFLTSVVWVMNKKNQFLGLWTRLVNAVSHSSGLFFSSRCLSNLSVSLWPFLSPLITKVLFIGQLPRFSPSPSLFFFPLSEHELQYLSLSSVQSHGFFVLQLLVFLFYFAFPCQVDYLISYWMDCH